MRDQVSVTYGIFAHPVQWFPTTLYIVTCLIIFYVHSKMRDGKRQNNYTFLEAKIRIKYSELMVLPKFLKSDYLTKGIILYSICNENVWGSFLQSAVRVYEKKINGVRRGKRWKKNESVCGHGPHTIQFSTAHFYYTLNYIHISSVRSRLELIVGRPPTQYTISSFVVPLLL